MVKVHSHVHSQVCMKNCFKGASQKALERFGKTAFLNTLYIFMIEDDTDKKNCKFFMLMFKIARLFLFKYALKHDIIIQTMCESTAQERCDGISKKAIKTLKTPKLRYQV